MGAPRYPAPLAPFHPPQKENSTDIGKRFGFGPGAFADIGLVFRGKTP
jgi:hypothetical protein